MVKLDVGSSFYFGLELEEGSPTPKFQIPLRAMVTTQLGMIGTVMDNRTLTMISIRKGTMAVAGSDHGKYLNNRCTHGHQS